MDISRLRPYAVGQIAKALAQQVEHLHGFQGRPRWRAAFHDFLVPDEKTKRKPESQ
jgi:hypothetical protein